MNTLNNLPKQLEDETPQWSGEIDGKQIGVFYDDDISGVSPSNKYAVFSNVGFHGWLNLGFVMSDLIYVAKAKPTDYQKAYDNFNN